MKRRPSTSAARPLAVLTCSLASLWCTAAGGETLTDLDLPTASAADARGHATRLGAALGAPDPELRLRRAYPVPGGHVYRFGQFHGGLPILDAELAVLVLGGRILAASGRLSPASVLASDRGAPHLSPQGAAAAVRRQIPGARTTRVTPGFWGRPLRRVWRVDYAISTPFGRWRAMISDASGGLLWSVSTLRSVRGRVYSTSPASGTLVVEELLGLTATDALVGEHAAATTCAYFDNINHCQAYAVPDQAGDYLYQPEEPSMVDPFAEVQAYYHVDRVHRWFHQRFGFSRPGEDQQIRVMVNFSFEEDNGQVYGIENAFFGDVDGDDREELVFGQAANRDYAYDADVIYHEFGHSVVAATSELEQTIDDLGWNVMSGALNEAAADYFSAALSGDGLVGEYAGGPSGIRQLSGDASCPGDLEGQSHHDSLIWSRANWRVREQTPDRDHLDEVIYTAVTALGQHADFAEASALVRVVAQETRPALVALIDAEYAAASLGECTRVVRVNPRSGHSAMIFGRDDLGGPFVPGPFQYRLDVPDQALEMEIKLRSKGALVYGAIAAFVRREETVEHRAGDLPVHHLTLSEKDPQLRVTLEDADNPLVPGSAYFVLPVNLGHSLDRYEISVSYQLPPEPDSAVQQLDAGGPDIRTESDGSPAEVQAAQQGCGCAVNQAAAGPWWLLLLALFMKAARRRRGR